MNGPWIVIDTRETPSFRDSLPSAILERLSASSSACGPISCISRGRSASGRTLRWWNAQMTACTVNFFSSTSVFIIFISGARWRCLSAATPQVHFSGR